ncbi:MAG: potassium channel protein [Planctomycetota bacterium]
MKRLVSICLVLVALTAVGTLGFWLLEDRYSLFDALYMSVITLTTVGYGEVHELSTAGRVFVMVYLWSGLGVFLFSAAALGEIIVRNQMRIWLEKRRMDTALRSIEDHFIICGYGRMGQIVCGQLKAKGLEFVVVETDDDALTECQEHGHPWIKGDATDDETLIEAGVHRARGLATVLGTDADNLYVVFSARLLAPSIQILARATGDKVIAKMERAGANRVVSPFAAGATKITQLLANPNVEDFMEIFSEGESELDLAEISVATDSPLAGALLRETELTKQGVVIVAIRRSDGPPLIPPPSDTRIQPGDSLIALGDAETILDLCSQVG